jgi:hypothetical protein
MGIQASPKDFTDQIFRQRQDVLVGRVNGGWISHGDVLYNLG